jgi:zinc/manganese transport system permease protein
LLRDLFQYHFMVNAFLAGSLVAVLGGATGYLVVLRSQTFAAHALSQTGFPGASGAVLLGVTPLGGLVVVCAGVALGIGCLGRGSGDSQGRETAAIGAIQTFALALGFLFVSLYKGFLTGATAGLLFGSFLSISDAQVVQLALITALALGLLAVVGRPLLFISVDPELAATRRVPVQGLAIFFLLVLGLTVGAVGLVTGVLLVFSLLVAPAAAAQQVTARPAWAIALGISIALLVMWISLAVAYFSIYPLGFFVSSLGFIAYLLAWAGRKASDSRVSWRP